MYVCMHARTAVLAFVLLCGTTRGMVHRWHPLCAPSAPLVSFPLSNIPLCLATQCFVPVHHCCAVQVASSVLSIAVCALHFSELALLCI